MLSITAGVVTCRCDSAHLENDSGEECEMSQYDIEERLLYVGVMRQYIAFIRLSFESTHRVLSICVSVMTCRCDSAHLENDSGEECEYCAIRSGGTPPLRVGNAAVDSVHIDIV